MPKIDLLAELPTVQIRTGRASSIDIWLDTLAPDLAEAFRTQILDNPAVSHADAHRLCRKHGFPGTSTSTVRGYRVARTDA